MAFSLIRQGSFALYILTCFCTLGTASADTNGAVLRAPASTSGAITLTEQSTLASARALVAKACVSAGAYNAHLREHPRLNQYILQPAKGDFRSTAPAFEIDWKIISAAALVAEADATSMAADGTLNSTYTLPDGYAPPPGYGSGQVNRREFDPGAGSGFWLATIGGEWPGSDPLNPGGDAGYTVFRNVKDYGATGNGRTDDTKAINKAISEGDRCGGGHCTTTSTKMAVIYFPPGTYLVSSSILLYFNTQMIGDATSLPIIKGAPKFVGLGLLSTDNYTGGTGEWFLDTANFYRAVRNFIIDIRDVDTEAVACVHWQVAQASSLENMYFYMKSGSAAERAGQVGIFSENGSGGYMGDLIFSYGSIGLQCGNQQFTSRNLHMIRSTVAVSLLWDWGWTFKSLTASTCEIGINITAGDDPGGSIYLLDSSFQSTTVGLSMPEKQSVSKTNYVQIDNLQLDNVPTVVARSNQILLKGSGGQSTIISWVYGRKYDSSGDQGGSFSSGSGVPLIDVAGTGLAGHDSGVSGTSAAAFFTRSRSQYETLTASDFVNAKSRAQGNGKSDDTQALTDVFAAAAKSGQVVYMPAGVYVVTDTIYIPSGTRIVGSCWSQIMASGSNFQNMNDPRAMLQIGKPGEIGSVELQDLLFTVRGRTAGAILVEWNLKASTPGAAAMWDSHYRVGGAIGTDLSSADCPIGGNAVNTNCIAASLMLHITSTASAYIENSWAWCADHDLDNQELTQVNIYSGRGVLIESQAPTWLYATASEHSVLYQYQLAGAENVFLGMIQTESPYWQPSPPAPAPFGSSLGSFVFDPDIAGNCASSNSASNTGCYHAWALSIVQSSNISIGGAGLYSWFDSYVESCVDTKNCQQGLVTTNSNQDIYLKNLYTIGSVDMIEPSYSHMDTVLASDNVNEVAHPFLAVVSAWSNLDGDEILSTANYSCLDDDPPLSCYDIGTSGCNASLSFNTLTDLAAASPDLPDWCLGQYAIGTLLNMLSDALNNYTTVDDGYDSVFGSYVTYVQAIVPDQVLDFVMFDDGGGGAHFFDCTFQEGGTGQNQTTQTCPLSAEYLSQTDYIVYYTLKPGMEANYSAALLSQAGVYLNWTQPGTSTVENICPQAKTMIPTAAVQDPTAFQTAEAPTTTSTIIQSQTRSLHPTSTKQSAFQGATVTEQKVGPPTCNEYKRIFVGFPEAKSDYTVPNPKDVVEAILPNLPRLQLEFQAAQIAINNGFWPGNSDDVVQTMSTAIFLFVQAVQNMALAKAEGEAEQKAEKQAFILKVLTIVFSVLPFFGAAGTISESLAIFGDAIALAGDVTNAGLSIYSIVSDPSSAPLQILGVLLGGVSVHDPDGFTVLAGLRRAMSASTVAKVGEVFETESDALDSIVKACSR